MGRVLGIDFGDKWIGLALSDPSRTFARPLRVVDASSDLQGLLTKLIQSEGIDYIVLGLPLNMDGSMGPKARQVLHFRERMEKESGLMVETWDERLTTVQADQALRLTGLSSRKRAEQVDKVAAQILLQSYLDCQKRIQDERKTTS